MHTVHTKQAIFIFYFSCSWGVIYVHLGTMGKIKKIRRNFRFDPDLDKHIESQPLTKEKGYTYYVEKALEKASKFKRRNELA